MLLIKSLQFIALLLQQELAQYIEPELYLAPYLVQLELQHEIESNYYQVCGRW